MGITHPDIVNMERFGTLNIPEQAYCYRCDELIHLERDTHYIDKSGRVFCSLGCAMNQYGIEVVNEVEVPY